MNIVKHGNDSIKINDLGFITSWSSCPLISEDTPMYLVVFEEYSRLNPFCQPLDMSENIEIESWKEDRLRYSKKIGEFTFGSQISVTDAGIDWSLQIDKDCTNYSIGLALPYYKDWQDCSNSPIPKDIANYSSFLHRDLYADQHILDIPCVVANKMMVFGNMKNFYQFFRYQDSNSYWIRTTTSTTNSIEESVEFCIRTDVTETQKMYLEKFPEADEFIHKWKPKFKELGDQFKIDIVCQQSEMITKSRGVTHVSKLIPTGKDLERYYPAIKKELEKYPVSLFVDLNIACIQLVADLWIQTAEDSGYFADGILTDGGRGLIINIHAPLSVLHHEIFHSMQREKKFSIPGEISQFSDSIQINDMNEFMAELFALLMTNPGKAYSSDLGISLEQIKYLKEEVSEFVNFPDLHSFVDHRTIFAITPSGAQEIEFGCICETATRYAFRNEVCQ